jgi:hypothetical protein
MNNDGSTNRPAYAKPGIEVLGNFAELTLGSKWQSLSDLSHGIGTAIGDGGPGS